MSKDIFKLTGEIQKETGEKFTKEEKDKLTDEFLEFLEQKNLNFVGIAG